MGVKPVATVAANDTTGATLTQADSSDLNVGAGLDENNAPDFRCSQFGRILAFVVGGNTYLVADEIISPLENDDPP